MKVEISKDVFDAIFYLFEPEEQIWFFERGLASESRLNAGAVIELLKRDRPFDKDKVRSGVWLNVTHHYVIWGPDEFLDKIPIEKLAHSKLKIETNAENEKRRYDKLIKKLIEKRIPATIWRAPTILGRATIDKLNDEDFWDLMTFATYNMNWVFRSITEFHGYVSIPPQFIENLNPVIELGIYRSIKNRQESQWADEKVTRSAITAAVGLFVDAVKKGDQIITFLFDLVAENKRYLSKFKDWFIAHELDAIEYFSYYLSLPEDHPIFKFVHRDNIVDIFRWFDRQIKKVKSRVK